MKRVISVRLGLLVAVGVVAFTAPARGAERYADQVLERTLPNGLKMLLLEDHKAPVAVVEVWYRVGARNELPGITGLSHMLEHMMFKGTKKNGPGEYSRIIARSGGDENAFTSDDATTYFAKLASDRIGVEIELEADRMRNLILNEELFEPERRVVMEERRLRVDDNPTSYLYETLGAATFLEHPYRQPTIGWASDIEGWKLSDLREHYDKFYQPNNAVLVAVGDFDAEKLADQIAAEFGPIPRGPEPPPMRAREPTSRGPVRVKVERPARLPFVAINYRVPNLRNPDSAALEVLSVILSRGKSSRLYRELVHERQLALDVDASYAQTSIDDRTLTLSAQAHPGIDAGKLEEALLEQARIISETEPTPEELARAKAQIESSFVFAQDSMFYRGMLLGVYEMVGDWRWIDDVLPKVQAVTAEDVKRVAEKYLGESNRAIGTLVPAAGSESAPPPPVPPASSQGGVVH